MKNNYLHKIRITYWLTCLFIVQILLFSCNSNAEFPTSEEAKVAVLEKITLAAEKWSNGETMGYLESASNDIVWIDDLGVSNKIIGSEALKDHLKQFNGKIPKHEFKLKDYHFQIYNDIVIVSYQYQGIFDGKPVTPWKVTSVYKYENNNWLSVHENWTEVKLKQ